MKFGDQFPFERQSRLERASRFIYATDYKLHVDSHVYDTVELLPAFREVCHCYCSCTSLFYLAPRSRSRSFRYHFLKYHTHTLLVEVLCRSVLLSRRTSRGACFVQPRACRSSYHHDEGMVYDTRTHFSVFVANFSIRQFSSS